MPDNMRENRNMKLHASGEDYLETILVLQKKLGIVRSVDVARHMGVSKPSVCVAVNTLKDGGFLTMDEDHFSPFDRCRPQGCRKNIRAPLLLYRTA